jgi:hypothetical protein
MASRRQIRLPRQWPRHIKSGILHAKSLASVALTIARGRATPYVILFESPCRVGPVHSTRGPSGPLPTSIRAGTETEHRMPDAPVAPGEPVSGDNPI